MSEKKDYLDDLPKPRVIQLCEYCDNESSTSFIDFLGNEIFICKECNKKRIKEYEKNVKKFRKAKESYLNKKMAEYEINKKKFMN